MKPFAPFGFLSLFLLLSASLAVHAWATEVQNTPVRFVNAVPDAPPLDFFVNGTKMFQLKFREVTQYVNLQGNEARVTVRLADTPIQEMDFPVELRGTPLTVAAVNRFLNFKINYVILEDNFEQLQLNATQGKSGIRAVHFSPDSEDINVVLRTRGSNPTEIPLAHLEFQHASEYQTLDSGCYDILARPHLSSHITFAELQNVCLEERKVYSVFAMGLLLSLAREKSFKLEFIQDYVFQVQPPPTQQPTQQPTQLPTQLPTQQPSQPPPQQLQEQPSRHPRPSQQPSQQPSYQPSRQPSHSQQPSQQPPPPQQLQEQPSRHPQPSQQPSQQPSYQPSRQPSHSQQPQHSPY